MRSLRYASHLVFLCLAFSLASYLANLTGGATIERLPIADLPKQIRDSDPNLRYAPTIRMQWQKFLLLLSDQSVAVGCKLPYPGWGEFRSAIMRTLDIIGDTNVVERVERYSLKYVDILESSDLGRTSVVCEFTDQTRLPRVVEREISKYGSRYLRNHLLMRFSWFQPLRQP